MKTGLKRHISAWLLLAVFVPMLVLTALHTHAVASSVSDECVECVNHQPHSGHLTATTQTLTDCVLAYCQNLESFGYQTMVYQNKRTTLFKLDMPRLKDIPFWLAEYGDGPTYIYNYDMWQYSCKGTVAGIEGNVDLNLCFRDFSQEGAPNVSLPAPDLSAMTTAMSEETTADAPDAPDTPDTPDPAAEEAPDPAAEPAADAPDAADAEPATDAAAQPEP